MKKIFLCSALIMFFCSQGYSIVKAGCMYMYPDDGYSANYEMGRCGGSIYYFSTGSKANEHESSKDIQCGSWQKIKNHSACEYNGAADDNTTLQYYACECDAGCLQSSVSDVRYFDNPAIIDKSGTDEQAKAKQSSGSIKLPVKIVWNSAGNEEAWPGGETDNSGDLSEEYSCREVKISNYHIYSDDCGDKSVERKGEAVGIGSYLIDFEYIPTTTIGQTTPSLNLTEKEKDNTVPIKNGKFIPAADKKNGIYQFVIGKPEFNEIENAKACFFESSSTIRWRVRPCCDKEGKQCMDEGTAQWQEFTTSTAPELMKPLDPDWNGGGEITKSSKELVPAIEPLRWCKAKLPETSQIKNRPVQYAKSYQMTMASDESNSFTSGLMDVLSGNTSVSSYLTSLFSTPTATPQTPHALALVNGNLAYNVFPDKTTGEVETWFPAQSRGDLAFFSRGRTYSWRLTSCSDDFTKKCFADSSQEWKIKTPGKNSVPPEIIPAPQAVTPKDDPNGNEPIGFPISLSWTVPSGANSFRYETDIPNLNGGRTTAWNVVPNNEFDDATRKMFGLDNTMIMLDTTYKWRVRSCAMFDSGKSDINDCDAWSNWFFFRTTGRPPLKDSMLPNMDSVASYPQNFTWEKVSGARSYKIKLLTSRNIEIKEKTVKFGPQDRGRPGTQFDYPDIKPPVNTDSKAYSWKVQTCADENGERCGAWSDPQHFTTARPGFPQIQTQKKIYGSLNGVDLAWTGQTKQYWITMNYDQTQPKCGLQNPIVNKKITGTSCSMQNGCIPEDIKTSCVGSYEWTIQPCTNPDCLDRGIDNIKSGSFSVSANASETNTLSVCGQDADTAKSEWDETEVCGIRHIFLFLKIAINFLLFKLLILMLPIFVLISGGWFYLSSGKPDTVKNVIKMWKEIGIAYGLMLLAWLLISWLLLIVGYNNLWWKIL
ncbi:MAG: hypothetical protein WCX69_05695 [Candidatus Paceibacterota bacterium]